MAEDNKKTALERLDQIEIGLDGAKGMIAHQQQVLEMLAGRLMSTEQSCIAVSKTLAAVVKELEAKKVIDSDAVMANLREGEDKTQIEKVQHMLNSKVIAKTDEVGDLSFVVVSQTIVELNKDSKTTLLADYRLIEMQSPHIPPQVKQNLLTRKVGEKFEEKAGKDAILITTVKEVYNLVEGTRQGEPKQDMPQQDIPVEEPKNDTPPPDPEKKE